MALAAATLGAGSVVLELWTAETPGWWFSLLFSVLIIGLVIGLWLSTLLQPQVPGVGAAARVWRAPGSQVVIEVLDPSAVPGNPDLPNYV